MNELRKTDQWIDWTGRLIIVLSSVIFLLTIYWLITHLSVLNNAIEKPVGPALNEDMQRLFRNNFRSSILYGLVMIGLALLSFMAGLGLMKRKKWGLRLFQFMSIPITGIMIFFTTIRISIVASDQVLESLDIISLVCILIILGFTWANVKLRKRSIAKLFS